MDPQLIWAMVVLLGAVPVGVAWIGKTIIKPWSDAYLIEKQANSKAIADKSQADVEHIRNIDAALVVIVQEAKKQSIESGQQTAMLQSISAQTGEQNLTLTETKKAIAEMNSDNKRLCRAELIAEKATSMGISPEKLEELLTRIVNIQEDAKKAAAELKETAKTEATQLRETATAEAMKLKDTASAEAERIKTAIRQCADDHPSCPMRDEVK